MPYCEIHKQKCPGAKCTIVEGSVLKCFYKVGKIPQTEQVSNSRLIDGLWGRTVQEQRTEILDRMKYFYMQTDETYKWPNSAEGDLLKMVFALLAT